MNKTRLLLLLALPLLGCQSEPEVLTPSEEGTTDTGSKITLIASAGVDSKVNFDETTTDGATSISLTWQSTDSFTVYDSTGARVGDFAYAGVDGAKSGAFTQVGSFTMADGDYTAVIPASTLATLDERDAEVITSTQTIGSDLDHLNNSVKLKGTFAYSSTNSESITFSHELSMLKLQIELPNGAVPATLFVSDMRNFYDVTFPADLASNEISTYIAVETNAPEASRDVTFEITDTAGAKYYTTASTSKEFAAGYFYTVPLSPASASTSVDYYVYGYKADNGEIYNQYSDNAVLIASGESTTLNANKDGYVYFVEQGSSVAVQAKIGNLVVIGRESDKKPVVTNGNTINFDSGTGIIFKNLDFQVGYTTYIFKTSAVDISIENWIVEDCMFTTYVDKGISYITDSGFTAEKIIWRNNVINYQVETQQVGNRLLALSGKNIFPNIDYIEICNNIFYVTPTEDFTSSTAVDTPYNVYSAILITDTYTTEPFTSTDDLVVNVSNNTFINMISTAAIVAVPSAASMTVEKNIFWAADDITTNSALVRYAYPDATLPSVNNISDNLYYGISSSNNWQIYNTGSTAGFLEGYNSFTKQTTDPLSICDIESGTFIQSAAYAEYGATISWYTNDMTSIPGFGAGGSL